MFKSQIKIVGLLCFMAILCSGSIFKKKYFEGKLYYSVIYDEDLEKKEQDIIQSYSGVQRHDLFKEGSRLRIFLNAEGDTLRKYLMDLRTGVLTAWFPDYDTLYVRDLKVKTFVIQTEQNRDTVIGGEKFRVLELSSYNAETYAVESWRYQDVLSNKLKVKPEWYKNYLEGGQHQLMKDYPYLSVCEIEYLDADFGGNSITTKLDSLEWRPVEDSELFIQFPDSLVRKTND